MQCPKCFADVKYKERSNNQCSKCNARFAFEPKTHPLQLTDKYFSKVVEKLSNNGKLFFTQQQLQFAVSRKKLKSNSLVISLIIIAFITTVISIFIYPLAAIAVAFIWIIVIIATTIYYKKNIFLPQTIYEFHSSVIETWRSVYKNYPSKLILNNALPTQNNADVRGILVCDDIETAICLSANQTGKNLGLAIVNDPNLISQLLQKRENLPIFLLHGASIEGYRFVEKMKRQFGTQTRVFDIGLRPQTIMKSKAKLRETGSTIGNVSSLTKEEIDWLNQGFYFPLLIFTPQRLIGFVTKKLGNPAKSIVVENPDAKAKSVGFMTWAGE